VWHASSIKDKIDAPPTNPDEQQIPKSAQRIAELRAKVKNGDFFRKKAKKPRPKEQFEQYPNESNYQFLLRVNRECSIIKHEAAFEDKFGVEVKKNEDGEIEYIKKRAKDPVQIMMKEARNQKKKKKKKDEEEPRLTKSQKRRLKLAEKKRKNWMVSLMNLRNFKITSSLGNKRMRHLRSLHLRKLKPMVKLQG
jgi:hypothetical protein